jgi:hypothetical protein
MEMKRTEYVHDLKWTQFCKYIIDTNILKLYESVTVT